IGIDLGGTKCAGVILGHDGTEIGSSRRPTPRGDYNGTIATIAETVRELSAGIPGPVSVGVGMPGIVDPRTKRVKNCNATWIQGRDFTHDLQTALGQPVRIANDGNCFTIAEARDGAARGAAVVFGATLGTGCGGGVVVNGRLLTGLNGIAGEWGHSPMPWKARDESQPRDCFCGASDCVERYLSGGGLAGTYAGISGRKIDGRDLPALLESADTDANAAMGRYEDQLAQALAAIVNVLDPDVIVLGGGVSNIERLYRNVPGLLGNYVFSDRVDTPVKKAVHGDAAGVRGAAFLWGDSNVAS
ncbi:MAG: ROK family protein, partial [Rhodospirillales bacterium]|nr:ROK family protein [Rhodospirillales bacterium]